MDPPRMTPNPLDPEDGPHRPDPADLPEGIEAGDLPRLPMTVRKRRPQPAGAIEVFGVDEQDAEPVELQSCADLASNVLRRSEERRGVKRWGRHGTYQCDESI